ncbi:hypothetical protein [Microbacterium sp. H1-D42]|uniref:hypothetical protein n=1 Tax=Microbacterium sp. H1-D42 TaxID=2925844 RepID=UPI001F53AED5|nr:hypothetical protein [Microbacterium sp. H1-D42]UNK72164.1 hypothetical protein MNR00_06900 [Microbacterium sp. H1-D42]
MTRGDRLSIGASIPGFSLPVLAVLTAVGGAMLLGVQGGWLIAIAVIAVIGVILPQVGGLWMAAGGLIIALALAPPDPARTAVAIAAVHLLQVLGSLSLTIPLRARVALRALAPTGIRFVIVQAIAQGIALAVGMLPQVGALPLAVVGGGLAVLVLVAGGIHMLRMRRQAAYRVRP